MTNKEMYVEALKKLLNGNIPDTSNGICQNVADLCKSMNRADVYVITHEVFETLYANEEHHMYPIEGSSEEYRKQKNKWEDKVLEMRKILIGLMINVVEGDPINQMLAIRLQLLRLKNNFNRDDTIGICSHIRLNSSADRTITRFFNTKAIIEFLGDNLQPDELTYPIEGSYGMYCWNMNKYSVDCEYGRKRLELLNFMISVTEREENNTSYFTTIPAGFEEHLQIIAKNKLEK